MCPFPVRESKNESYPRSPSRKSRVEVWRGGSVSTTGLRLHTPLIKLDRRFSRIQLSLQGVSHH